MSKTALVNANSFGRYFPEYIEQLEDTIGEVRRFKFPNDIKPEELAKELEGYQYIVIGTTPQLPEAFFEKMPGLKFVARFGIGYNNVDVEAANAHGVMVSNIPAFMEREDVAEHAMALTMDLAKRVAFSSAAVKNGEWATDRGRYLGYRLNGKTVGICGFGNIGARYAEMMHKAFDCRIICYDPFLTKEQAAERGGEKMELDELLAQADIISLHMNQTPENTGLFNKEVFAKMKNTAILVNCARGGLVNEADVEEALNQGKIAGFGADVLCTEPPKPDHPLLHNEKAVVTPHIGAYNRECNCMMCTSVVEDIQKVEKGGEPTHRLMK